MSRLNEARAAIWLVRFLALSVPSPEIRRGEQLTSLIVGQLIESVQGTLVGCASLAMQSCSRIRKVYCVTGLNAV